MICIPSTVFNSVNKPFASSTVITPSLPTVSIAAAIISPIAESLFAEIVAICRILLVSVPTSWDSSDKFATIAATALSIPRLISVGLDPAATNFIPAATIAWANTVAVVVPSPATSAVLDATSFTSCAPTFSIGSFNSISFATVTPSFVTCGGPYGLLITTSLPAGPSVTLTALANASTPAFNLILASVLNSICFDI